MNYIIRFSGGAMNGQVIERSFDYLDIGDQVCEEADSIYGGKVLGWYYVKEVHSNRVIARWSAKPNNDKAMPARIF